MKWMRYLLNELYIKGQFEGGFEEEIVMMVYMSWRLYIIFFWFCLFIVDKVLLNS